MFLSCILLSLKFFWLFWFPFFASGISDQIPIVRKYESRVLLREGSHLRLLCPVVAPGMQSLDESVKDKISNANNKSSIFYDWSVNNRPWYILSANSDYQLTSNHRILEVNHVKESHSGEYECSGTTGFGNQKATFSVRVLSNSTYNALCSQVQSPNPQLQGPCFVDASIHQSRVATIYAQVGKSVTLNCEAFGVPEPTYLWQMNSQVADWIDPSNNARGPIFQITKVKLEHAGRYTCKVENSVGMIEHTFQLVVRDYSNKKPKIVTQLSNHTLPVGEKVDILCKITCDCQPVVQWLKRVEVDYRQSHLAAGGQLIHLPNPSANEVGEEYVTLTMLEIDETASSWTNSHLEPPLLDDTRQPLIFFYSVDTNVFMTRFLISNMREKDAGKYVLLAMSRSSTHTLSDIDYEVAYLSVTSETVRRPTVESSNSIVVYIAVPLSVLLLMIGLCIYCLFKRYRINHQPPGSSGSRSATSAVTTAAGLTSQRLTPSLDKEGPCMSYPMPTTGIITNGQKQYYVLVPSHEGMVNNGMPHNISGVNPVPVSVGRSGPYYLSASIQSPCSSQEHTSYELSATGMNLPSSMIGGRCDGANVNSEVSVESLQQMSSRNGGGYFPGNNSSSSNGGYSTSHTPSHHLSSNSPAYQVLPSTPNGLNHLPQQHMQPYYST